jgi:hypothetical protein
MISNLNPLANSNLSGSGLSARDTASQSTQAAGAVSQQGRAGAAAYLQATDLPAKLPELAVGEQVNARVVEQLDAQRVVALIKNNLFTLSLSQDTQLPGKDLKLTVASLQPNLSFTLSQSAQDGQTQGEGSAQVVLSPSAQYLTNLLSAALGEGLADGAASAALGQGDSAAATAGAPVFGKPPLLGDGAPEPTRLAAGLAQAVNRSGVFYESHVKSWAEGQFSLDNLQQEPQARMAEAMRNSSNALALASTDQSDTTLSGNRVLSSSLAPQLGQLVQRQLDTLENRAVFVQVMAWPNQQVTLQIQQDQVEERNAQEQADDRAWTSRLTLDMPQLGSVNVNVRLVNGTVQVDFRPHDDSTSELIREHAARLASGMEAAGLNLAQLTVQHGEETRA